MCSSRYETIAITPLEAAMNDVTTVLQNSSEYFEAARYFPDTSKFVYTPEEIANGLQEFFEQDLAVYEQGLKARLEAAIPEGKFESVLEMAWL